MKTPPTWEEALFDKYGDKGDEMFGLAKHNNTILNNIIDDFRTILTSHEATIRKEIGERVAEKKKRWHIRYEKVENPKEQRARKEFNDEVSLFINSVLDEVLSIINPTP